jgi:hypothetical protein
MNYYLTLLVFLFMSSSGFAQKHLTSAVFTSLEIEEIGADPELVFSDSAILTYDVSTAKLEELKPVFGLLDGTLSYYVDYDKQPFVQAQTIDVYSLLDAPGSDPIESISNTISNGLIVEQVFEDGEERFRYAYNAAEQVTSIVRDVDFGSGWIIEDSITFTYNNAGKKMTETTFLPDQNNLIVRTDTFTYSPSHEGIVKFVRYGYPEDPGLPYSLLEQYDFVYDGDQIVTNTYDFLDEQGNYAQQSAEYNYTNDQLIQIIIFLASSNVTGINFEYNMEGNISKVAVGLGPQPFQVTNFEYDSDGFLIKETFTQFNGFFSMDFYNESRFYYDDEVSNVKTLGTPECTIYPNPVYDRLTISSSSEVYLLKVFRMDGRQVLEQKGGFDSVDIDFLVSGCYIFEVYTEDGIIEHKIIKE